MVVGMQTMQNDKTKIKQSPELSKVYYVDAKGRLCKRQSKLEKLLTKVLLIFQTLPVLVSFMLIGLTIVEIACFVKLYEIMNAPSQYQADLKIYVVLAMLIGTIVFFCVRIGLFFAEKHIQDNQNFFKTRKSKNL